MRAALLCLLLTACASFDYSRDVDGGLPKKLPDTEGSITVIWRLREDAGKVCTLDPQPNKVIHACTTGGPDIGRCVIIAPEPKGFHDRERLALLGHELLHCMGATHR